MRLFICLPLLLAACSPGNGDATSGPVMEVAGMLEPKDLDEASGLTRSVRSPGIFWAINDDGPAVLFAIDETGRKQGKVRLKEASNRDWEAIASFSRDGVAYVAIADIGDNEGVREHATIYVIEEPATDADDADVAWQVDFSYPDGPRDAEALAVDESGESFFVLSKRDIPAVLYRLPLVPVPGAVTIAERLGEIASLPQPSRRDIDNAGRNGWSWQPTAMDFSADGRQALILTYRGVYLYSRAAGQSWFDALNSQALELKLGKYRNAEAIAFSNPGTSAFVTIEKKHAPLLRIDLADASAGRSVTLMTFNVENLFDNDDDPGKDDKAYLPIAAKQSAEHIAECNEIEVDSWRDDCLYLDWSDAVIDHKLGVLADVIRQVNAGHGADVIALQEVENVSILERLRVDYLGDLGYGPAILLEGNDSRGIDIAFLSRLPLVAEPVLHPMVMHGFEERAGDTRGILQASFALPGGAVLTGFAVHFPAPYHPTEMRVAAYEHLNRLRDALPGDHNVFAAGDFNTTSTEDRRERLLETFVRPHWSAAHELCRGCPGTHFYARDESWSFLDMILFSPARGGNAAWSIRADSVQIANRTAAQVQPPGVPLRYDARRRQGVSDHWPLAVDIQPAQER